jgi:hypothetical protein
MSIFLQPLQTVTVGSGGATTITFSSIPQGYTDLKIFVSARGTGSFSETGFTLTFNGDSSSNYSNTRVEGSGSSASSGNASNATSLFVGNLVGTTGTANTFASNDIYVPNYTGSNYKSVLFDYAPENNGTANYAGVGAGLYRSTSAITSITFGPGSGTAFAQYSTFSIYGVLRQGI